MRRFVKVLALVAMVSPAPGVAQTDETLADIRQELSVLYVELQKLKRELSTTGSVGDASIGGSALDRVAAIESELQRLTSKTEELEFRIDRVVSDGTNRVGDLEYRLCELEQGCDVGTLEEGSTLGGVLPATGSVGTVVTQPDADGPQMAVGEESDFRRAEDALNAGDYAAAAEQFASFQNAYPGGPLTARAGLMRGQALEGAGELTGAARAYLDTFSAAPTGPVAPEALYHLGNALGGLGQTDEACVTLGEVGSRFPQTDAATEARTAMADLGCS
ncbi:tol-pal system protein YbgF [Roseovarius litorisediminis]|uniref:Cell division coordinator CpoB n=1 Tax=Roseovarius litorisediminis TaxID=1312363 RepID=A0A1Y5SMK5_9RHOB|nr:tol-pal system protein YbgF [Roseovarius litorisediminis]SLN41220.1 tol-pal system protein YbgF [Roseovarius litorisediminis]